MEDGRIPDQDITASSSFDPHSVGAAMGRARQDIRGGAWCPANTISKGVKEWLEIDLKSEHRITAIETMGRFGGGQGQEFAGEYRLEYWRRTWHSYPEVMKGNTNTYLSSRQDLPSPVVASKVRFIPYSVSIHPLKSKLPLDLFCLPQAHYNRWPTTSMVLKQ